MSFFRHGEIYHFEEGAIPRDHALAPHRNDEFPAGYSLAGCSPAEPASASPAGAIMLGLICLAKDFAANGKLSLISLSQLRVQSTFVPQKRITGLQGLGRQALRCPGLWPGPGPAARLGLKSKVAISCAFISNALT